MPAGRDVDACRLIHRDMRRFLALLVMVAALPGCATLQSVAALRQVTFAFDHVSDVRILGIGLDGVGGWSDLTPTDVSQLLSAATRGDVPLALTMHVRAENPADNHVTARLVGLEWTFFVEDRRTVSGRLPGEVRLPPGEAVDVRVPVSLDLADFFHTGARDLFELALGIAGRGTTRPIRLEATPVIDTPAGPIRYPQPIVIERAATR